MDSMNHPGDIEEVIRQLTQRAAPLEAALQVVESRIAAGGMPGTAEKEWARTRDLLEEVAARYNAVVYVLNDQQPPNRVSHVDVEATHLKNNLQPFREILQGWVMIERGKLSAITPTREIWDRVLAGGGPIKRQHQEILNSFNAEFNGLTKAINLLERAIGFLESPA